MRPTVRERLVLPLLLPIGILVVIAAALFGFSRILLSLTAAAATTTALIVAGAIVAVSAIAASRPQIRVSTIASMLGATAGVAMLAGGIALAVVAGEGEEAEPGPGGGPGAGPALTVTAQNIAFDTDTIELPADTPITIRFENRDTVPHNIAIYPGADEVSAEAALFQGEIFPGPDGREYEVPPLEPGEYYFQCDVHPSMNGTVVVERGGGPAGGGGEGEEPGGGGGPGGGGATAEPAVVVAQNIAFDTSTIRVPAGQQATVTMDNRDAGVQHNIAIYSDASRSEELSNPELFAGPGEIDYSIPALEAGEYYFVCIVHPNMNGTLIAE